METINSDVFSVIASFLTTADGARLSTVSKEVSKLVLENKKHFQPSSFFKRSKWASGHDRFVMVEHASKSRYGKKVEHYLCTDHLSFNNEQRIPTKFQKRFKDNYKYMIYVWDEDALHYGTSPHFVSKEDYYRIRSDYALYIREKVAEKKKAAEEKAKADAIAAAAAEYKRKHPVVPLKAPSKPAPWCK